MSKIFALVVSLVFFVLVRGTVVDSISPDCGATISPGTVTFELFTLFDCVSIDSTDILFVSRVSGTDTPLSVDSFSSSGSSLSWTLTVPDNAVIIGYTEGNTVISSAALLQHRVVFLAVVGSATTSLHCSRQLYFCEELPTGQYSDILSNTELLQAFSFPAASTDISMLNSTHIKLSISSVSSRAETFSFDSVVISDGTELQFQKKINVTLTGQDLNFSSSAPLEHLAYFDECYSDSALSYVRSSIQLNFAQISALVNHPSVLSFDCDGCSDPLEYLLSTDVTDMLTLTFANGDTLSLWSVIDGISFLAFQFSFLGSDYSCSSVPSIYDPTFCFGFLQSSADVYVAQCSDCCETEPHSIDLLVQTEIELLDETSASCSFSFDDSAYDVLCDQYHVSSFSDPFETFSTISMNDLRMGGILDDMPSLAVRTTDGLLNQPLLMFELGEILLYSNSSMMHHFLDSGSLSVEVNDTHESVSGVLSNIPFEVSIVLDLPPVKEPSVTGSLFDSLVNSSAILLDIQIENVGDFIAELSCELTTNLSCLAFTSSSFNASIDVASTFSYNDLEVVTDCPLETYLVANLSLRCEESRNFFNVGFQTEVLVDVFDGFFVEPCRGDSFISVESDVWESFSTSQASNHSRNWLNCSQSIDFGDSSEISGNLTTCCHPIFYGCRVPPCELNFTIEDGSSFSISNDSNVCFSDTISTFVEILPISIEAYAAIRDVCESPPLGSYVSQEISFAPTCQEFYTPSISCVAHHHVFANASGNYNLTCSGTLDFNHTIVVDPPLVCDRNGLYLNCDADFASAIVPSLYSFAYDTAAPCFLSASVSVPSTPICSMTLSVNITLSRNSSGLDLNFEFLPEFSLSGSVELEVDGTTIQRDYLEVFNSVSLSSLGSIISSNSYSLSFLFNSPNCSNVNMNFTGLFSNLSCTENFIMYSIQSIDLTLSSNSSAILSIEVDGISNSSVLQTSVHCWDESGDLFLLSQVFATRQLITFDRSVSSNSSCDVSLSEYVTETELCTKAFDDGLSVTRSFDIAPIYCTDVDYVYEPLVVLRPANSTAIYMDFVGTIDGSSLMDTLVTVECKSDVSEDILLSVSMTILSNTTLMFASGSNGGVTCSVTLEAATNEPCVLAFPTGSTATFPNLHVVMTVEESAWEFLQNYQSHFIAFGVMLLLCVSATCYYRRRQSRALRKCVDMQPLISTTFEDVRPRCENCSSLQSLVFVSDDPCGASPELITSYFKQLINGGSHVGLHMYCRDCVPAGRSIIEYTQDSATDFVLLFAEYQ